MNRHIRASLPTLLDLARRSKYASESAEVASTYFTKKAHLINLDGINCALVEESIKLGSAILKSIEATKQEELISSKKNSKRKGDYTKESMSLGKGLATGAAIAAIPALAANYTINRAEDKLHENMLAVPGIAAATVGAILAAKQLSSSGSKPTISKDIASELENAIEAREVLDSALASTPSEEVKQDLRKMSSISTDHIASLIADILV